MKAWKTFWIGVGVCAIGLAQFAAGGDLRRLGTVAVGLFFIAWGWKIGWTKYRGLTALVGHLAVTAGCLAAAWGAYLIPFQTAKPTLLSTLDMPLFWGLFTLFGGYCMITHSYCSCTIRMHEKSVDSRCDGCVH